MLRLNEIHNTLRVETHIKTMYKGVGRVCWTMNQLMSLASCM